MIHRSMTQDITAAQYLSTLKLSNETPAFHLKVQFHESNRIMFEALWRSI